MSKRNGICIELTPTQFDYLYEMIMFGYEMEVPEQKGWDVQTYDNMVDNVTNGKSTYLSNDVKGRLGQFNQCHKGTLIVPFFVYNKVHRGRLD